MSVSVRAFVCPRSYLRNYTSDLHQYFVRVTYDRGSVLFWRRSHTLRTSGFTDDIIFAHKLRLLDVAAQLKRTRSLGLVYKVRAVISVAGLGTHRTAFGALKVTSQVATPGAESAVYDCMVLLAENATPKSTRSELNAFSRSCARLQTTAANDPTNCRLHPTNYRRDQINRRLNSDPTNYRRDQTNCRRPPPATRLTSTSTRKTNPSSPPNQFCKRISLSGVT